jgi:hypothetical protein
VPPYTQLNMETTKGKNDKKPGGANNGRNGQPKPKPKNKSWAKPKQGGGKKDLPDYSSDGDSESSSRPESRSSNGSSTKGNQRRPRRQPKAAKNAGLVAAAVTEMQHELEGTKDALKEVVSQQAQERADKEALAAKEAKAAAQAIKDASEQAQRDARRRAIEGLRFDWEKIGCWCEASLRQKLAIIILPAVILFGTTLGLTLTAPWMLFSLVPTFHYVDLFFFIAFVIYCVHIYCVFNMRLPCNVKFLRWHTHDASTDMRADSLSLGQLKHDDALLCWVEYDYSEQQGLIDRVWYLLGLVKSCRSSRLVSAELLTQIMTLSNTDVRLSDDQVWERLTQSARNCHSVNISRDHIFFGDVVHSDTVELAVFIVQCLRTRRGGSPFRPPRTV